MPDREKVIKGLQNLRDAIATDYIHEADQAVGTIEDAIALLKEQDNCENCAIAIEDRQPVVRCKDCVHKNGLNHCPHNNDIWVPDDWFCADGKRLTLKGNIK